MWSVLENVPGALDKNLYFVVIETCNIEVVF